jgi:hypothetical protein
LLPSFTCLSHLVKHHGMYCTSKMNIS